MNGDSSVKKTITGYCHGEYKTEKSFEGSYCNEENFMYVIGGVDSVKRTVI